MQVVVDVEAEPAVGRARGARRLRAVPRGGPGRRRRAAALDGALRGPTRWAPSTETARPLVAVDAVRRLAAGSVGATWEDDFAAMLDYARSKGWLSDDGASIRAHVEWG